MTRRQQWADLWQQFKWLVLTEPALAPIQVRIDAIREYRSQGFIVKRPVEKGWKTSMNLRGRWQVISPTGQYYKAHVVRNDKGALMNAIKVTPV